MGREGAFDSFYSATRQQLLHEAFVLTGDLPASAAAVREAYVAAWHHWRKVSRAEEPLSWVRSRAWVHAQRRHTARIWHRSKGVSEEQRAVLDALARLTLPQRRALLLIQVAGVDLPDAARFLGLTQPMTEQVLQSATANLAAQLEIGSAMVRPPLMDLASVVRHQTLPRAPIVRRAGKAKRHTHAVVAGALAILVAVASGALVHQPGRGAVADLHLVSPNAPTVEGGAGAQAAAESAARRMPTADQMLDHDQISRLGPHQQWRVLGTSNNTSGDGINTICQQRRFADPDGLSAIVRRYATVGEPLRTAVQTVELSRSVKHAEQTYQTALDWYAGCQLSRLQILKAYRVDNIGDQADVLMLRVWSRPISTYSVAIARVGTVTTTTVGKTVGAKPPPAHEIVQSLADAVAMVCARSGSKGCAKAPDYQPVAPPPSGGEAGILAVADLPPVGRIDKPWVGTDPASPRQNPSETTCDHADFTAAGAVRTRSRTYLIPQATMPARFGLSETYGVFPTADAAAKFLAHERHEVSRCEHRDLATTITRSHPHWRSDGERMASWSFATAVTRHKTVRFRIGFVRVGDTVAQLTFASAPHDTITVPDFRALVHRAGARLRELG